MEKETGDDYIRRLATFIRANERGLAESGLVRRRKQTRTGSPSLFSPFGWLSPGPSNSSHKPVVFSTDTHHLFYTLIRFEALGFDVGPLDVRVESPSRPMSYTHIYPEQKDAETLSLASLRSSLSLVSNISLGGSWWTGYSPPAIDGELRYVYSSFTKIPALSISAPGQKVISELVGDPPDQNAIPLDIFKNLQRLECENIDPRTLLGWDRVAESLRSLKIKKSGLDDISQIIMGAVLNDQARRQETSVQQFQRRQLDSTPTPRPSSLPPDNGEDQNSEVDKGTSSDLTPPQLSSSAWALLKHLYLPDNSLTSFPSDLLPYLTSLTHLDLSSNLLVSIPPGFGELHNLLSLNLSDNLIDSVLGIFLNLGQVLSLNLSHNRLDSLCGLERLLALERIDLRHNLLEESSEIGRLAPVPNLSDLWVDGNPFVEIEEGYRVTCFNYFWRDGKEISLDGTRPNLYERRNLTLPDQAPSILIQSTTSSAPVIAIEHSRAGIIPGPQPLDVISSKPSRDPSFSTLAGGGGQRRKKLTRIVDLEGNSSDQSSQSGSHSRLVSNDSKKVQRTLHATLELLSDSNPSRSTTRIREHDNSIPQNVTEQTRALSYDILTDGTILSQRPRHSRHQTEYIRPSPVLPPPQERSEDSMFPHNPVHGGSTTSASKSEKRRTRVSASFFEPSNIHSRSDDIEDDNMDAYRKRIESLKQDMGDSWLKVYNQSHSS